LVQSKQGSFVTQQTAASTLTPVVASGDNPIVSPNDGADRCLSAVAPSRLVDCHGQEVLAGFRSVGLAHPIDLVRGGIDVPRSRSAWWLPTLIVIGVGVAWSTTLAVLGAFWGRDREFIRTPKFGIGPEGGHWHGRAYVGRPDWGSAVEVVLGLYCVWTTWLCWRQGSYGVLPFLALYATGFLAVGLLTMRHSVAGLGRRS
jgi:hypothetical protein